ncbi:hypothetical protein L6452_20707 [Arctium lappa]|uniref:Uncharacterized protein n=1 Tax=Arctium lappa TaxID=4217 RepID=A0ACB9BCN3_ARCLA|nr:hypothetical protein L6452_20707 [Arctium lappa]
MGPSIHSLASKSFSLLACLFWPLPRRVRLGTLSLRYKGLSSLLENTHTLYHINSQRALRKISSVLLQQG